MKKLLVYTSKTGTTKKCVDKIICMMNNIDVINLDQGQVNINDYDLVIIGTPIRFGLISNKIREFINNNMESLLSKKSAMFICCGFNEDWENYYQQIDKRLLNSFTIYTSFGGEMNLEKQKGFDKLIVRMVSKSEKGKRKIKILDEKIDEFIKIINNIK